MRSDRATNFDGSVVYTRCCGIPLSLLHTYIHAYTIYICIYMCSYTHRYIHVLYYYLHNPREYFSAASRLFFRSMLFSTFRRALSLSRRFGFRQFLCSSWLELILYFPSTGKHPPAVNKVFRVSLHVSAVFRELHREKRRDTSALSEFDPPFLSVVRISSATQRSGHPWKMRENSRQVRRARLSSSALCESSRHIIAASFHREISR